MTIRLVLALLLLAAAPSAGAKAGSVTVGSGDAMRFDTDGVRLARDGDDAYFCSYPCRWGVMNGRPVFG